MTAIQFVRNGFFCADIHDSKEGAPVFNRIVSLKSSFQTYLNKHNYFKSRQTITRSVLSF